MHCGAARSHLRGAALLMLTPLLLMAQSAPRTTSRGDDDPALAAVLARATLASPRLRAGTAAALETADVALMGDDLGRLPFAIGLSRQSRRVITQNLVLSLSVIAVLVIATVSGAVGIGPTVIAVRSS